MSRQIKIDTIYRQAAINAIDKYNVCGYVEEPFEKLEKALLELPSAQPVLYGYRIEDLAYIARVMEKEGVTPEYVARTLDDISRVLTMIIEETQEKVWETLNERFDLQTGDD